MLSHDRAAAFSTAPYDPQILPAATLAAIRRVEDPPAELAELPL
jgi:hypothetical protein